MSKLALLRQKMLEKGLDAYVIYSGDAHQSEYVADYWLTRVWISGFAGSAGTVVVTANEAGLWTDGRYFIQAEKELAGSGIDLFKMGEPDVPKYEEFLADKLPQNGKLGFDGRVLSASAFETLKANLAHKQISFCYNEDIAGDLWADRPSPPTGKAFAHDIKFAGKTSAQKLAEVRAEMQKKRADVYIATALDDIAWLTNTRGTDVAKTPVTIAYSLITMDDAFLFIDDKKITDISLPDFNIQPYDAVFDYVVKYSAGKTLLYYDNGISVSLFEAIPKDTKAVKSPSIIAGLKAIKNEVEIKNLHNAFTKDGVVMVKFFKWLEECNDLPDEVGIQNKLSELRIQQKDCLGDSFSTIAAYGKNAALPHYSPKPGACSQVKPEGLLLVDTGSQYLDGTTDITRTVVMGNITDEMRKDFTLVLKAHIGLSKAKFAQGVAGCHIDAIARQHMWEAGADYKHGTGHGIGFCLGVHEGPHNVGLNFNETKLAPGMLISNEPGLYKVGRHGVRTETVVLVKELEKNEHGTFLGFETLTLFPYDLRAVDMDMLTQGEKDYINSYHSRVYDTLLPHLSVDEAEWLKNAAKAI